MHAPPYKLNPPLPHVYKICPRLSITDDLHLARSQKLNYRTISKKPQTHSHFSENAGDWRVQVFQPNTRWPSPNYLPPVASACKCQVRVPLYDSQHTDWAILNLSLPCGELGTMGRQGKHICCFPAINSALSSLHWLSLLPGAGDHLQETGGWLYHQAHCCRESRGNQA